MICCYSEFLVFMVDTFMWKLVMQSAHACRLGTVRACVFMSYVIAAIINTFLCSLHMLVELVDSGTVRACVFMSYVLTATRTTNSVLLMECNTVLNYCFRALDKRLCGFGIYPPFFFPFFLTVISQI